MTADGTVWRWVCGVADRARVLKVPPPGLVSGGESPLSERDCLDPRCLDDPSRLYPAPRPIRPDVWETIDEADFRFTLELWRALGEPTIRWLASGHIRETIVAEVLTALGLPRPLPAPGRLRLRLSPVRQMRWAA